jgi:PAS domain S-box-containing protein
MTLAPELLLDANGAFRRPKSHPAMKLAFLPFVASQEDGPYPNLPSYAPGGLVRLAPDGRIMHATPTLAEMLGQTDVGALINANIIEFCVNPDAGRRLLLRLECENLVRHFEMELRRFDSVGIDVRVDGRGFRGRNGQLRHSEALIQDVSASRRMESAIGQYARTLEESEKRFRRVLDSSLDALAITACDDGTYVEVNREFEELTGLPRAEILGRTAEELELWADRCDLRATLTELADGGVERDEEVRFRRKDGTVGWATLSAVRIEFENRACILSFARDITARRREEDALEQPTESERAPDRQKGEEARKPLVLVVEPDPDTRLHMNAFLNGRYEVLTAATESDARNLLAAHVGEIEIILMDVSLNGTDDGLRLTKSLREEGAWTDVPIIATMARALPEDEKKALAAGCNGYLVKPFRHQEVLEGIEDLPFRPRQIPSGPWKEWRRSCRRLIRHALRTT